MKIAAQQLVKAYKGRRVVDKVSFSFDQGEVVGLLGPNGAGKTTTFYIITGVIQPNSGTVIFDDEDVTKWPMYKRARAGIGYLPQETSVFRRLSVRDNIRLVLEFSSLSKPEIDERVEELAEALHITQILDSRGGILSGGEMRRVEIARALATKPRFILLDEPFTGIDPVTIEELQKIILRLRDDGIGILITDHNVSATLSITDRNYILIDGVIRAEGDEAEIRANAQVRKFYLGQGLDGNGQPDEVKSGEADS
ncbi:MAG: LPS export ABC transporter ATP-binding protein [Armatimonadetes bacterium]|nr:LPS export ABC transporter ATP-binding protein [Armatimonadota bacterium]